ncbi:MAG: Crp/Fnr family transcriptional regulator [Acidihalobacter sp.]|uniref:Crp/Fnr family transcriptional regulator n=1 Tax=Acidihalobacter sp. TaxID=1872108 RepID=UPI00307DF913
MHAHHHADPLPERLRPLTLFNGLQDAELGTLATGLQPLRWAKRAQVMPAADTTGFFYVLLDGRVRIEAEHPDSGRAVTLYLLDPGDGHNLITLLDGQPHRVLAETLDETQAVCAPLARWHEWMRCYPPLRRTLLHCAATRLRELTELAEDLALHETSARLAHLLLRHIDTEQGQHSLLHGLVHEDIARLIGSVRVVVNRLLNRFKHEGIIDTDAGHIHITDLEGLLRKAERRLHSRR